MKRGPYKPHRGKTKRKAMIKQVDIDIAALKRALKFAKALRKVLVS